MVIAIKSYSREQMLKRLARRKDLKYPPDRYPDSRLPGHERKNFLIIGGGLQIEGGKDPMSAIPVEEGFLMSYIEAKPGNGPKLHVHDSNETFVALKGTWRVIWGVNEEEHVDLGELDVFSTPPGVPIRFVNQTPGQGSDVGLLMSIQAGNRPAAEWIDESHRAQSGAAAQGAG